jgi:hypothetical protein
MNKLVQCFASAARVHASACAVALPPARLMLAIPP